MVIGDCPRSLKEAKLPRDLGSALGSFSDWVVDWHKVHLGELFDEDLTLTEVLFAKGPSHDVFRALVGLQSQCATEDIVQYVTQNVTPEANQRAESARKYLDGLTQRDAQQGYGLFTYLTETGQWGLAVQWTGSSKASTHGSLQKAALSALQSGNPCYPKVSTLSRALDLQQSIPSYGFLPVAAPLFACSRYDKNIAQPSVSVSAALQLLRRSNASCRPWLEG